MCTSNPHKQLLDNVLGQMNVVDALAPLNITRQLSQQLPNLMGAVTTAVTGAQSLATAALPPSMVGDAQHSQATAQLEQVCATSAKVAL